MDKSETLNKELKKWEAFYQLSQTKQYKEYLKPLLEQTQNKWLDPAQFKTVEEFHKAYSESWGRAKAFTELLNWFDNSEPMITQITKQLTEPERAKGI